MAGKTISKIRMKCIKVIDVRVQKMNELLTFIKLIKMYAWELPFSKAIGGSYVVIFFWWTFFTFMKLI